MSSEQNQTAMKWKSHFLVLCLANQNYDNIREANQILIIHLHNTIWSYLWNAPYYPVTLWHVHSHTSAQIGVVMTNNVQEFCCSFD